MKSLSLESLEKACRELARRDRDLAAVLDQWGCPPMWQREPGFPTLVHIILEQQVSLASARAAFVKLQDLLTSIEPTSFLDLDDATLKGVGFSRQKICFHYIFSHFNCSNFYVYFL